MTLSWTWPFLTAFLFYISGVIAQFGLTTSSSAYTVNTGGGLIFVVSRSNGDVTSLNYRGTEFQSSEGGKYTHINSGLGSSTVSAQVYGSNYIKITIQSSGNPVTQYIVAKNGYPTLFLATYITGEVSPGELRWLARLRKAPLPTGIFHPVADNAGGTAIEGSDVFLVNGQTRCKFFSSERYIDDKIHYISGPGVYVSMVMPGTAYETSSGGPFFRDINNQGTANGQELYLYMNSGHVRTEPWRMGLKGPYAMVFSQSGPSPDNIDTSFFSELGIQGYVAQSGRGRVQGSVTGIPSGFEAVLHWHNTANQYWVKASGGSFTSPYMKPGAYTMKLYKQELLVRTQSVTVSAGSTTTSNIASEEVDRAVLWRIGNWDGQPFEFKNGDKFLRMHPSDSRMSSWGGTYTVGSSSARDFPMALFSKTGGAATVRFTLTSAQTGATTLRIGTTLSFKGGRPAPSINGAWSGSDPGAPTLIDSRGVTRGAYRGYGNIYQWSVPSGVLRAGENTLTLGVFGSGDSGYLSANYIVDALELWNPSGGTVTSTANPTTNPTTGPTTSSTQPTATPTPTGGGGEGPAWSQCGGIGWTGPTSCVSGYKCQFSNDYYSQCVPV